MKINLVENQIEDLEARVRAILGVPELILIDDVIASPVFMIRAENFINKKIKDYENLDGRLIEVATVYYICYLLCPGMYARLPKQMENVSTKTILQNIDWDKMALEMFAKCNEVLEDAISEVTDSVDYSVSFATLTASSEYPNTNI